ncbi:MAG: ABC transporter permease [Planctomycetota bacterium]
MIQYIKGVFYFPVLVYKYRELWWSFVKRELKAKYEGSILGRFWPIIQPLALFIIYYLVFAKLLKIPVSIDLKPWGDLALEGAETLNTSAGGWRSTFFLVSGILPWVLISESIMKCTGIVLENANLIKKISFPSEFLPFYVVVMNHIYFLIGFVIFVTIEWAVNGSLPVLLIWFPLLMLLQALFILGLSMLAGALNIFIRDVSQVVPLLIMFWMFTSPVFYEPKVLAMIGNPMQKDFVNRVIPYLPINPVYNLLTLYRDIFKYGRTTEFEDIHSGVFTVTDGGGITYHCLWIFAAQAIITFVVGYAFYLRSKGRFADEV